MLLLSMLLSTLPTLAATDDPIVASTDVAARDALFALWPGEYDLTEETIVADTRGLPLLDGGASVRFQYVVRPVQLPALGSHVLYLEEFPYENPAAVRRQVLLLLEPTTDNDSAAVRVRQYTRRAGARRSTVDSMVREDLESLPGCDLWLAQDGGQFRGGTRGQDCAVAGADLPSYIDYQMVVGDNLLWYRRRTLDLQNDDLLEEVAGFRYFELEQARLFNCRISWSADGSRAARRVLESVDVHDQGGRARFTTPDGRELELELHGRDWPAGSPRASLMLLLNEVPVTAQPLASSWTALGAAEIGLDIGWLAIYCAAVVAETAEDAS